MNYEIIKGDLFSAPRYSYLLHSCNCQGVWGSGVAVGFKENFPLSFNAYKNFCQTALVTEGANILGSSFITGRVICLLTSYSYGKNVDTPEEILKNTKESLEHLFNKFGKEKKVKISSPRINAGLFKVPWEKTEELIKDYLKQYSNIEWDVYSLD